jgi:hypothetical protein
LGYVNCTWFYYWKGSLHDFIICPLHKPITSQQHSICDDKHSSVFLHKSLQHHNNTAFVMARRSVPVLSFKDHCNLMFWNSRCPPPMVDATDRKCKWGILSEEFAYHHMSQRQSVSEKMFARANQNGSEWCYGMCYGISVTELRILID